MKTRFPGEVRVEHSGISINPRKPGRTRYDSAGLRGTGVYLKVALGFMFGALPVFAIGLVLMVTGQSLKGVVALVAGILVLVLIGRSTRDTAARFHEVRFLDNDGMYWVSKSGSGKVVDELEVPFCSGSQFKVRPIYGGSMGSAHQVELHEADRAYFVATFVTKREAEDLLEKLNRLIPGAAS